MITLRSAVLLFAAGICAFGQTPNISGNWKLNVDKSKWGKRDKPTSIELSIEHNEPAFKYKGAVLNADGSDRREFTFDGAIDGKAYPANGADGDGTITFTRVNKSTIKSTFNSKDGKVTESATTAISSDGKQLTRRMYRKGPTGTFTWTEVYDRT